MSNNAHAYWNLGFFGLKHIRGGSFQGTTEMVLEFEWQPKHPELDTELICIDTALEDISISLAEGTDGSFNWETRQELRSGDLIILTTTDPENHPLPDERLIKLQWLL